MAKKPITREEGTMAIMVDELMVRGHQDLEKNIGKVAIFQGRKVRINHLQKMWGYDENGKYTFGCIGYRVEELEPIMLDKKTRLYPFFPAMPYELEILDNVLGM